MFATEPLPNSVIYVHETFVSVFGRKGISFSSAFSFTAENERCIAVGLYIKLFQITPYDNDFQTLNNPGSGQPVDAS